MQFSRGADDSYGISANNYSSDSDGAEDEDEDVIRHESDEDDDDDEDELDKIMALIEKKKASNMQEVSKEPETKPARNVFADEGEANSDNEEMADIPTNEDLFFDPEDDDKNEEWISTQRKKAGGRSSDAILSCPCCFTILCIDCQQHEVYPTQFRAMFTHKGNCEVLSGQVLKATEGDDKQYNPVQCAFCHTEVGVKDTTDEVFVFFNVVPSQA
eukprot:c40507_g1_i1.p1 GENE.c40507_g1_i1~~c40507_g1_i1.p1  ORF type:complete len:215 (+),score=61.63 c40507_g1_i1:50-694(+)